MIKSLQNKTIKCDKGLWYALSSVLPYSIIPLVFLIHFGPNIDNFQYSMARGAVTTLGKDFLGMLILTLFVLIKERNMNIFRFAKTKTGLMAGLSGIFGGPIGYTLFNASFYMAGPAYSHVFTSLEPIILAITMFLIYKRKFKWQAIMGIILATAGVISMVAGEASTSTGHTWEIVIGSLLGFGGATAWAIETLLMDRIFSIDPETKYEYVISIKQIFGTIFGFTIMFPSGGAEVGNASITFEWFASLFTNTDYLWRFLVVGVMILAGRMLFFAGVKYKGATFTAVVYEITVVLIPVFSLLGYAFGIYTIEDYMLGWQYQLVFWICAATIVGGAILVIIYPAKLDRNKENKKIA